MSKSVDSNEYRSDTNEMGAQKSPERLEREVDQARARLGRTADELSYRLSPGELIDQALGMAREHGGEFGRNLGAQVKNNPLPMILTSVGISWMMMSSGRTNSAHAYTSSTYGSDTYGSDTYGTGTSDSTGTNGIKNSISDKAAKTRDKAAAVGDRMHHAGANARDSVQSLGDSLVEFYRDQPLLAGSLGIAIGAALGAMVPPTELEDETFGETRDRSFEAAKSAAQSKYDEVRASARPQ